MDDGLYLYCIAPDGHAPPPDLRGMEGRPVRPTAMHGLLLWTSELAARPRPSLERVRRHDRVVQASVQGGDTPLPMRFGQWFPSRAELDRKVGEQADRHRRRLRAVAGAREFGVRVLEPSAVSVEEEPGEARSGRDYMERLARREGRKRDAEERGRRLADELAVHLEPLTREEFVAPLDPEEGLVSIAHLVSLGDAEAYREAVAEFGRRKDRLRFVVTGPWPPYSFVEEETSSAGNGVAG